MDIAKNFAKVNVDPNGNYDDNDTSIDLVAADAAKLPATPFNATWWNATDYPDPADDPNVEIVRVTDITGDTLTITRGEEGTAGVEHNLLGKTYKMIAGLTAKVINDEIPEVLASTGAVPYVNADLNLAGSIASYDSGANVFDIGPSGDVAGGAQFDPVNNLVTLGDRLGNNNGTFLKVDDANQKVETNKAVVLSGIPNSDPSVEGALYYDSITGIVKRSAG